RRVPPRPRALQRQRAGGRVLLVGGGDVVLDQDRDPLERPPPSGLFRVEGGGDGERVPVHLTHRIEARTGAVIGLDARQIGVQQRGSSAAPSGQHLLQIAHRRIL